MGYAEAHGRLRNGVRVGGWETLHWRRSTRCGGSGSSIPEVSTGHRIAHALVAATLRLYRVGYVSTGLRIAQA
eukprot:2666556-Rhodomonas_salina.3